MPSAKAPLLTACLHGRGHLPRRVTSTSRGSATAQSPPVPDTSDRVTAQPLEGGQQRPPRGAVP